MQRRLKLYRQIVFLCLILLEILLIWLLLRKEAPPAETDWLTAYATESDEFRAMNFGNGVLEQAYELAEKWKVEVYSILAAWLVEYTSVTAEHSSLKGEAVSGESADPTTTLLPDEERYREIKAQYEQEKSVEWTKLINGYRTILADVQCFPVALDENGLEGLTYENGWGDARTYGGDRLHEGTDICDRENVRGSYPIVSMTEGVVEHVGWLEQGGYRIGIRSPHGAYFYYAHLASYAKEFSVGETVTAGQVLGMMGDTGYSKVEGTTGNFVVHLHLGIYFETDHYAELSVNPYYILKYLENSTVSYTKESYLWYTEYDRKE